MPEIRDPYARAMTAARARLGRVERQIAREVAAALEAFVTELRRSIDGRSKLTRSTEIRIVAGIQAELNRLLERSISRHRTLTYEQILSLWDRAGVMAAGAIGVDSATLGALRLPEIQTLGIYDAAGSARTWRTLIGRHTTRAAREAGRIVRLGFVEGIGVDELERRLRRYVVGSEPFRDLFENVPTKTGTVAKIDLRKVPRTVRDQARQMRFNALRIGFSEQNNARKEAEVQTYYRDPFIEAIYWELSLNRGSGPVPDECDFLNANDFFGLGPGVYPILKVPIAPHPLDRCNQRPVRRPLAQANRPKPNPRRSLAVRDALIPRGGTISTARAKAIRKRGLRAIKFGEIAGSKARAA